MQHAAVPPPDEATLNIDIIYPATERHIAKHTAQRTFLLSETPHMYRQATLPHLQAIEPAAVQWVYNILEKKEEAERLIFQDEDPEVGFMLHPDLKWDQTQVRHPICTLAVYAS